MANRFGRKQKRKLREQIEQLEIVANMKRHVEKCNG